MDDEKAVIIFYDVIRNRRMDLEIPLFISASDLVFALNSALDLNIDTKNVKDCFLRSENPIALLKGNKTLFEYGIHNGSVIYHMR